MNKQILTIVGLLIFSYCITSTSMAQAKFAGAFKNLVGKRYKQTRGIAELKTYAFKGGSLVSEINDPDELLVNVYQKGTVAIVFFSKKEQGDSLYTIADVLEVKDVQKGWQIRTTFCSEGQNADVGIVALLRSTHAEIMRNVKQAWRFNRDKIRFEKIDPKNVSCISEGGD